MNSETEFSNRLISLMGRDAARQLLEKEANSSKPNLTKSPYQIQYWNDPIAWAYDFLVWPTPKNRLTAYQEEILNSIPEKKRVCVRGPHGLGKTALASLGLLWFACTRDGLDWKVLTTASAWRQLIVYLWPEVHKWSRRIRWAKLKRAQFNQRTELMTTALKLSTGEATAVASDNFEFIEGAHADYMLWILDEGKAIPDRTWDAVEGAFAGAGTDTAVEAYALAISTPGEPVGRFYDIHMQKMGLEDWHPRHVTLKEAIKSKRISKEWAAQRKAQWGENSVLYQNRVLGEFGNSESDGVIPYAWLTQAMERYPDKLPDLPDLGIV